MGSINHRELLKQAGFLSARSQLSGQPSVAGPTVPDRIQTWRARPVSPLRPTGQSRDAALRWETRVDLA